MLQATASLVLRTASTTCDSVVDKGWSTLMPAATSENAATRASRRWKASTRSVASVPILFLVAVVVVAFVLAAGGIYRYLRDDAPAEVSLEAAAASVADDATTATTTPSTTDDTTDDAAATPRSAPVSVKIRTVFMATS